jgi:hypothetical protein
LEGIVFVTFYCCDKYLRKQKRKFILALGFRGFDPWLLNPLFWGLSWVCWSKAPGSRESDRKGPKTKAPFKDLPPLTYFFQPGPIS